MERYSKDPQTDNTINSKNLGVENNNRTITEVLEQKQLQRSCLSVENKNL